MENVTKYLDKTIESVFAERFGRYSKYIIQERALPDVRDGLKPVQRRILYAMYKDNNVFDKQFRKSAKTVGNVIGNYHPHGDSSVYEAMVRMSQSWKINQQLVVMHGNNGSIDGDNPAAMRYTEAKLSQYSDYMLKDIEEKTVAMFPNFDDTQFEPGVLPCKIPNLLINGTSGIASGYATEIPPHNMKEVLQAAIYLNKNKDATLFELMKYVKAPDFPTGGIIHGTEGIVEAYTTGKGKLILSAKYEIVKNDIIISEIPYDVNKAVLLHKIEMLKIDRKVDGINEIIDQSGQEGLEIKIVCAANSNVETIMNYLLKNTDLQKNYNFNMIAINNKKPELMGLKAILSAFLEHREDIITKRSEYLLKKAQYRSHITEGIIEAISNLDKVVAIIRQSMDKSDAKSNLIKKFKFSEEQAEAIVMMQLYRLTNTDIISLEKTHAKLSEEIKELTGILNSRTVLLETIETELEEILAESKSKRLTKVEKEYVQIEIKKEDLIKEEKNIVVLTDYKFIKRTNLRSYVTAKNNPQIIEGDALNTIIQVSNKEKLIVFFDKGQYALTPTYEIVENKWKESGKPIANLIRGAEEDKIIKMEVFNDSIKEYISITSKGYILKIASQELKTSKEKQRIKFQGMKKDDYIVSVIGLEKDEDLLLLTDNDNFQMIPSKDLEKVNMKRTGTKLKGLNKKETIVAAQKVSKDIICYSQDGYYGYYNKKELLQNNFRFEPLYKNVKSKPQKINRLLADPDKKILSIAGDVYQEIESKDLNISHKGDRLKQNSKLTNIDLLTDIIEIK